MSDSERIWAERVHELVLEGSRTKFTDPPPIVDISVAYEMGLSPEDTASALLGIGKPTLTKIIDVMREHGMITQL